MAWRRWVGVACVPSYRRAQQEAAHFSRGKAGSRGVVLLYCSLLSAPHCAKSTKELQIKIAQPARARPFIDLGTRTSRIQCGTSIKISCEAYTRMGALKSAPTFQGCSSCLNGRSRHGYPMRILDLVGFHLHSTYSGGRKVCKKSALNSVRRRVRRFITVGATC